MMARATLFHVTGRFYDRGFTLVEAVMVIVITAIVMAGVATFLRLPVSGYIDSAARADMADTADTALRRMARDIRVALPNSVRVSPDASYIEMLETRTGGRYLSVDDNPTSGLILNLTDQTKVQFDVVGPLPSTLGGVQAHPEQQIQAGSDSVVIYNLGQGIAPVDAYLAGSNTNRVLITGVSTTGGVTTITMASNPFATQSPQMPSPYYRFQVISGPVTYHCDTTAQTLTRYWNYTISATQPTSVGAMSSGQSAILATGVTGCNFAYTTTNTMSSALVVLNLTLTAPASSRAGSVGLFQQVHVDNTP